MYAFLLKLLISCFLFSNNKSFHQISWKKTTSSLFILNKMCSVFRCYLTCLISCLGARYWIIFHLLLACKKFIKLNVQYLSYRVFTCIMSQLTVKAWCCPSTRDKTANSTLAPLEIDSSQIYNCHRSLIRRPWIF